MKRKKKIYHLHLHEPYDGKHDLYFSSKTEIFNALPEEVVGCSMAYIVNKQIHIGEHYANRKCIITAEEIR
ncbi:MAG: hypothetical protein Q4A15_12295 [Prevotellaceae bacterium]|nr:hypothetical protein [Prevotellaceae bacterium]